MNHGGLVHLIKLPPLTDSSVNFVDLRKLALKYVYDSDQDNILDEFYIPALSESVRYRRLAGSFSSSALAVAARGISRLIANGGTMRLVAGAELRPDDVNAIMQGLKEKEEIVTDKMMTDLDSIEDEFVKDHVKALAWMVANNRLEIKIAIVLGDDGMPLDAETVQLRGIFHPKIGILEDDSGNVLTFGGSINESMRGWLYNDEHFYVFPSWIDAFKEITEKNVRKFETCWNGLANRLVVLDVPDAYKQRLIKIAPASLTELNLEKWYVKTQTYSPKKGVIQLRDYQQVAVENWIANGGRGMMEMATGSGKTYTAIAGISKLEHDFSLDHLCIIITCPYTHLVSQWQRSLEDFGYHSTSVFGGISNWKKRVENAILRLNGKLERRLVLVTTHDTFSSEQFMWLVRQVEHPILLIADEVHAVGSEIRRNGLLNEYTYRLGLSATPKRYFDEEGTDYIFNFFGPTVAEFTLGDAIKQGYLVPYIYHTAYVTLNQEELEEYRKLTRKIATQMSIAEEKGIEEDTLTLYQVQRQKIVVNASEKLPKLKEMLVKIAERLDHCLIYCSDSQIDDVQRILNKLGIIHQRVTFREGTEIRNEYLRKFDEGVYKVIVAINVLDEGVDIPSTKMAIIMASTGNPKQYIQRRGRVLRPYPGKDKAEIYDMVVLPPLSAPESNDFYAMERKILIKELKRHEEMARLSLNSADALNEIENIKKKYEIT